MANSAIYKYYGTSSFSGILNSIHKEMDAKMERKSQDNKAQQIENVLREIKRAVFILDEKKKSGIDNYVSQEMIDLIEKVWQLESQHHNQLSNTALFRRQHGIKSISGTDDIFEEELAFLIKAATQIAKMPEISIDVIIGGKDFVSSAALDNLTNKIEQQQLRIMNQAVKKQQGIKANSPYTQIIRTAGKTDIHVPTLQITGDTSILVNKLLSVLSGVNFTLKNYMSVGYSKGQEFVKTLSDINIHLGNTNPYKAITGALSEIYSDPKVQEIIFHRGMVILSGRSQNPDTASPQEISQHFAHLRFIFELRGSGQIDINGRDVSADYIIWNDPKSENIVVRNTAALIKQNWENYAKVFSPIAVSANRLVNGN